jgi:hypothetical protein
MQLSTLDEDPAPDPAAAIRPDLIALPSALVDHRFLFLGAPIPDEVLIDIADGVVLPLLTGRNKDQ